MTEPTATGEGLTAATEWHRYGASCPSCNKVFSRKTRRKEKIITYHLGPLKIEHELCKWSYECKYCHHRWEEIKTPHMPMFTP